MKSKKYATGTTVKNYQKDPATVLAENDINVAKAKFEAESDPFTNILSLVGNAASQYGMGKLSKGTATQQNIGGFAEILSGAMQFLANGGTVDNIPVEVEGEEVIETPDGKVGKIKGASHENGGVKGTLPEGTEVFSKRLQIDGETMAERKLRREKAEAKLTKQLSKNFGDKLLKTTLERTQKNNEIEEEKDKAFQQAMSDIMDGKSKQQGEPEMHWGGLTVGKNKLNQTALDEIATITEEQKAATQNKTGSFKINPGDATSLFGNLVSSLGPYLNTLKSRATDVPNVNTFETAGEDSLQNIQEAKDLLTQSSDNQLKSNELSKNAGMRMVDNTSRGINTSRAMKAGVVAEGNKQENNIYAGLSDNIMKLLGQESSINLNKDQLRMQGEQTKLDNNSADKDAFYSALSQNIADAGTGIQQTGKEMNAMKLDEQMKKILDQLSKYGIKFDNDMNLVSKPQ